MVNKITSTDTAKLTETTKTITAEKSGNFKAKKVKPSFMKKIINPFKTNSQKTTTKLKDKKIETHYDHSALKNIQNKGNITLIKEAKNNRLTLKTTSVFSEDITNQITSYNHKADKLNQKLKTLETLVKFETNHKKELNALDSDKVPKKHTILIANTATYCFDKKNTSNANLKQFNNFKNSFKASDKYKNYKKIQLEIQPQEDPSGNNFLNEINKLTNELKANRQQIAKNITLKPNKTDATISLPNHYLAIKQATNDIQKINQDIKATSTEIQTLNTQINKKATSNVRPKNSDIGVDIKKRDGLTGKIKKHTAAISEKKALKANSQREFKKTQNIYNRIYSQEASLQDIDYLIDAHQIATNNAQKQEKAALEIKIKLEKSTTLSMTPQEIKKIELDIKTLDSEIKALDQDISNHAQAKSNDFRTYNNSNIGALIEYKNNLQTKANSLKEVTSDFKKLNMINSKTTKQSTAIPTEESTTITADELSTYINYFLTNDDLKLILNLKLVIK